LIEEGIDLSIRITSRLEPGDIVRKLGESRLLTVASPQYLAEHGNPKHPRDLSKHACLVYSQDFQSTSWGYRSKEGDVNVTIRPRMAANNGEALLQAAAQGLGITRPPDFMVQPFLESGSVVAVLPKFEPTPLGIYAVLPSNRYIPHRVSVLIDFLASALEDGGPTRT
jgi:DNA-binding transcriptional LysR family regulator